jgi:hypothetical protein
MPGRGLDRSIRNSAAAPAPDQYRQAAAPGASVGSGIDRRRGVAGLVPIGRVDLADHHWCRLLIVSASSLLSRRRERGVRSGAIGCGGIHRHCLSRDGLCGDCLSRGGSVLEQRLALTSQATPNDAMDSDSNQNIH